jgi:two-component system cell cycle response regulator DivK
MPSILVVDDNDKNLRFISDVLEVQGYVVHTATNGPDAIHAAQTLALDLILMDVQMPGMSGTDAMHVLKAQPGSPPILAVTALAMRGDDSVLLEQGFDGYISKPVALNELISTVRSFLQSP